MSEKAKLAKLDEINAIKDKIEKAKAIILVDYKGLTVEKKSEAKRS